MPWKLIKCPKCGHEGAYTMTSRWDHMNMAITGGMTILNMQCDSCSESFLRKVPLKIVATVENRNR